MFSIDADNNITMHAAGEDVAHGTAIAFASEKEFAKITADWKPQQFVELWNSFAGTPQFASLRPVSKFVDRNTALRRIWKAIHVLAAPTTAEAKQEIKEKDEMPNTKKKAAKGDKKAKGRAQGAPKPPAAKKAKKGPTAAVAAAPREGSRKEAILGLITRKNGATLGEIMKATGWQAHSVRGFLSTLGSKGGYKIDSSKSEAGERTYKVTAAPKGGQVR